MDILDIFIGLVLVAIVVVAVWAMINKQKNPVDAIKEVAKEVEPEPKAPTCGCGRSPTGNCVGLHKLTDEEWAVSDKNPNKVVAKVKKPRAPKKKKAE